MEPRDRMELTEYVRQRQKNLSYHRNGQSQVGQHKDLQVIYVHGMFSNSTVFKDMLTISNEFIPSHAIDLIGHGERKNEFSTRKPVSFYHYVGDVLHAVRNKPSIVVGHSIGALAALVAKTTGMPEANNIQGIITISSACPKGIYLPLGVMVRMALTPHYLKALITAKRFKVKKEHARQFLLNNNYSTHLFEARYRELEDESGYVLGQLTQGISLPEVKLCPVHMIQLGKDRLATEPMQTMLANQIRPVAVHTVLDADHMQLDSTILVQKVTALLEEMKYNQVRYMDCCEN